jgi:hypothetical protein
MLRRYTTQSKSNGPAHAQRSFIVTRRSPRNEVERSMLRGCIRGCTIESDTNTPVFLQKRKLIGLQWEIAKDAGVHFVSRKTSCHNEAPLRVGGAI